jgi:3-phosphoshikimate 1-carboxyvinyltransferase
MKVKVSGILSGSIVPPPSKSQAHRLLICAALGTEQQKNAGSTTLSSPYRIACTTLNDDLIATKNSLNSLGAQITYSDGAFLVHPIKVQKGGTLNCGESGSTLRFLLSVAAVLGADATFIGEGKLPQRPNGALRNVLSQHGIMFEQHNPSTELPLTCKGALTGGKYALPGDISSQYLTGLLFALPLADEDSEIEITGTLTSASYIGMTLNALKRAGIVINCKGNKFYVPGRQQYTLPENVAVEGDWSAAAFWVVAGVIGKKPITICGMDKNSLQGDKAIIEHLRKMGAFIEEGEDTIVAMPSQLFGAELDCMDTPDLVPILAVAAAAADGETLFTNVGRLRYKESDRLSAMQTTLAAFGIASSIGEDTFTVYGGKPVVKEDVESFSDHRIAMSAAILATIAEGETSINGAECVAKSYPHFFNDYSLLGGNVKTDK